MFSKILDHKITIIIVIALCVAVAAGSAYFLFSPQKHPLSEATARIMTIKHTVSADGKIDSDRHVTLAFQKAGQITAVNVKVGDTVYAGHMLAAIDSATLRASLQGAEADVQSAEAGVIALRKGATAETRAVYDQNISTAKLTLSTAVSDAYLKIQDALLNKISSLFNNNTSANPTLIFQTDSFQKNISINNARVDMTTRMNRWNSLLGVSATSDETLTESTNDIAAVKDFVNSLSFETNRLTNGNSGLDQKTINGFVSSTNGASTEVNAAQTEFNSALQAYKTAADQLNVIEASSTPEAMRIAESALSRAEANVASIQSQIADTVLTAPFDGVVASVNPRVGENFPANVPAVDVLSTGAYKVDVMIPENEVASISVGDEADIRFDAYGDDLTATGTVASIDLSETVTNGVGAYKTTIYLNGSDSRVRTGMTANVTINGVSANNVVAIPASAIIVKNGGKYALLIDKTGSYAERKIGTGISDGDWTEVISGIQAGEKVATFGTSN